MKEPNSNSTTGGDDEVHVAQELIKDLSAASKKRNTPDEFYGFVIAEVARVLDLSAAFVWVVVSDGLRLVASIPAREAETAEELVAFQADAYKGFLTSDASNIERLEATDNRCIRLRKSIGSANVFSGQYRLLHDGNRGIVLELLSTAKLTLTSPLTESLVGAIREIAEDFHRNFELERLRESRRIDAALVKFAQQLFSVSNSTEREFQIVNAAVEILGFDRASFLEETKSGVQLKAVSGVSSINQNAESVKSIRQYAEMGIREGLPAQFQLEDSLSLISVVNVAPSANSDANGETEGYQDNLGGRILVLESLNGENGATGLTESLEKFTDLIAASFRREFVATQNRGHWRLLGKPSFRWCMALTIGLVLAMMLIPSRLQIRSEGQIKPEVERGIYAPVDGEVVDVRVEHDEPVERDHILLVIESPDLELKLADLRGRNQATAERIRAIEARFTKENDSANRVPDQPEMDAASIKELEILLESQAQQLKILEAQKKALTIRSPIKGRVVTWQLDQLLKGRQVQQGQLLLSIVGHESKWLAEIEVKDHRIGHVLERMKTEAQPSSECMLVSDPDQRHTGRVVAVARTTSQNQSRMPVVKAIAEYEFSPGTELRSGAKIVATIDCGNRSLGYVYFHEFYHSLVSFFF